VPKALAALNDAARVVPSEAYVLGTIAGLIVVIPDELAWGLDEALNVIRCAKVGFSLRVGVSHGTVEVVDDIDDQKNLIGPAINSAARIATSAENSGGLVHESYANLVASTLSPDHWLHRSRRVERVVKGKPQDKPFLCYVVPDVFAAQSVERSDLFRWAPAVLIAYDLPTFSGGDRSALRKRFTRLSHVFKRLWQTAPMPALLSPGGDGGVVALRGLSLSDAGQVAERLRTLANSESLGHSDSIAVRLRIGVHYGHITDYQNARGIARPAGLELFVADEIAGDDVARTKKDIIVTNHLADAIANGNQEELSSIFEELPRLSKGPAAGVPRFVRREPVVGRPPFASPPPPSPPTPPTIDVPALPPGATSPIGFPVAPPFESLETGMISAKSLGTKVVPSIWRIGAVPAVNRTWTKAQLYTAIEDATPTIAGDFGRRPRVPAVLRPGATELRRDDGTQVRRIIYQGGGANERHEEQLGIRSDGAIWFQRAHFWDATETWLDLGQCAFDVIVFMRLLVIVGNSLGITSYNVTLTVEAPKLDMVATIQTNGLAAKQEMRTARIKSKRQEGKLEVGPSTSLPEAVQVRLVKQLVDAIANECELEKDPFHRSGGGAPFLEIDEASIAAVLEAFK